MPKRKRAASEGCYLESYCPFDSSSTSPIALTSANLKLLQRSIAVAEAAMPAASSSSRSAYPKRNSTTHDGVRKLGNYNIHADVGEALPDELQRSVDNVILKPRDPTSPASPNAKKIMQHQHVAANSNEMAGREQVVP